MSKKDKKKKHGKQERRLLKTLDGALADIGGQTVTDTAQSCFEKRGWEFEREGSKLTADIDTREYSAKLIFTAHEERASVRLVYPFTCLEQYRMVTRDSLMRTTSSMVFGAFRMDSDGEISVRQTFIIGETLDGDSLLRYIDMCLRSYEACFDRLRRFCTGEFSEDEKTELYDSLRNLIVSMKEGSV